MMRKNLIPFVFVPVVLLAIRFCEVLGQTTSATKPDLSTPLSAAVSFGECIDKGNVERLASVLMDDPVALKTAESTALYKRHELQIAEMLARNFEEEGVRLKKRFWKSSLYTLAIRKCEVSYPDANTAVFTLPEAPMCPLKLHKVAQDWRVDFAASVQFGKATEPEVTDLAAIQEINAALTRVLIRLTEDLELGFADSPREFDRRARVEFRVAHERVAEIIQKSKTK